jgi:hypothetical protein
MKSSTIISLFGETPAPKRGPSAFVISIFVHSLACVLLFLGLNQPHTVEVSNVAKRFTVRMMELHQPEPKIHQYVPHETAEAGLAAKLRNATPGISPPTAPAPRLPSNFQAQKQVEQTLIQPDVTNNILIPKTPLPQVTVWSSRDMTVRTIVPTSQQTEAKIEVQPSLEPPNQAVHVSDLKISPGPSETKAPLPEPSKTSPVTAQGPAPAKSVPETASKNTGQPTPASVISMSDVQMKEGTATLPAVNQVAPTPLTGSLSPGQQKSTSQTGSGTVVDNKPSGAGAGQTTGQSAKAGNAETGVGTGNSATGAMVGLEGPDTGAGLRSLTHLALPRDGAFGVVVVGASAADDYPEAASTWRGRLAYTVYLHVGTHKNWILQYSVPRSEEAAKAGNARPDAPWPYDITRPSIDTDTGADAIIIHGFVNAAGHFERLAVVFPTELAEAKFLIHALQQWQFRPATQNGQTTQVEVLLIIPDESD